MKFCRQYPLEVRVLIMGESYVNYSIKDINDCHTNDLHGFITNNGN